MRGEEGESRLEQDVGAGERKGGELCPCAGGNTANGREREREVEGGSGCGNGFYRKTAGQGVPGWRTWAVATTKSAYRRIMVYIPSRPSTAQFSVVPAVTAPP